jgi:hypothetical protein
MGPQKMELIRDSHAPFAAQVQSFPHRIAGLWGPFHYLFEFASLEGRTRALVPELTSDRYHRRATKALRMPTREPSTRERGG